METEKGGALRRWECGKERYSGRAGGNKNGKKGRRVHRKENTVRGKRKEVKVGEGGIQRKGGREKGFVEALRGEGKEMMQHNKASLGLFLPLV